MSYLTIFSKLAPAPHSLKKRNPDSKHCSIKCILLLISTKIIVVVTHLKQPALKMAQCTVVKVASLVDPKFFVTDQDPVFLKLSIPILTSLPVFFAMVSLYH
jgi:hypothetical protein